MSRYKAVLFDMDGTLVNTEPLHVQAWIDTLAHLNLGLKISDFHQFTGLTDRIFIAEIGKRFGLDLDVDALITEKEERFLEYPEERYETFEGVIAGLEDLMEKFILALVTSSTRLGAIRVLKSTGIYPFFDTIITYDDVDEHKPAPQPYVKAVEYFDLNPDECIAVEDSKSGCASAKAAGCYTVGVLNSFDAARLESADLILETSKEVMSYLKQM